MGVVYISDPNELEINWRDTFSVEDLFLCFLLLSALFTLWDDILRSFCSIVFCVHSNTCSCTKAIGRNDAFNVGHLVIKEFWFVNSVVYFGNMNFCVSFLWFLSDILLVLCKCWGSFNRLGITDFPHLWTDCLMILVIVELDLPKNLRDCIK